MAGAETNNNLWVRGECFVSFGFDIGLATDLSRAQTLLGETASLRSVTRSLRRSPSYLAGWPGSLCVRRNIEPLTISGFTVDDEPMVSLFDFGAVSVTFAIPFETELAKLATLSEALYENERLLDAARCSVREVLEAIRPAVTSANLANTFEDYSVFWLREMGSDLTIQELETRFRPALASILRAEAKALSPQEIEDSLSHTLSYTTNDRAIIDWNSSIVIGSDMYDVVALLEFANVELLELAFLDSRLREYADRTYGLLQTRRITADDLNLVRRFQMDSADLLGDINNPLRLFGDHFLARVHRAVAAKFDLRAWVSSIENRLEGLSKVANQMAEHRRDERSHSVEVFIAILILVDIVIVTAEWWWK